MSASVTIYTTEWCPYCVRAKRLLDQKGVAYEDIDVADRPDLRKWLVDASRQRTVPQIFINGRSIGGYTELADLECKGALAPLLATDPTASDAALRR
jgi:glutaredoxin 3